MASAQSGTAERRDSTGFGLGIGGMEAGGGGGSGKQRVATWRRRVALGGWWQRPRGVGGLGDGAAMEPDEFTERGPFVEVVGLQVTVGNREYSGNIEQDALSFPVTSLRESMVIMLYSADGALISKSELKTKEIVESGTMDTVFALDSGGEIVLQIQFLLNDDDRKRIQEMRNSAMKMKQQGLLGDGNELNFSDSALSKRLTEKISNIRSKAAERSELQKSMSLDDLQERAVFPGIDADPRVKASRDSLLQGGVRLEDPGGSKQRLSQAEVEALASPVEGERRRLGLDVASGGGRGVVGEAEQEVSDGAGAVDAISTWPPDRPGPGSKKGDSIPESSKSSSAVKTMISSFEGTTTPQGIVSETDSGSRSTQAGKTAIIPVDDHHKASNHRSQHILVETIAPAQLQTIRTPKAAESRSRRRASKQHNELHPRTRRRSQAKQMQMQMQPRDYVERPLNYLVATSSTWIHPHICVTGATKQLKDLLELEHLNFQRTATKGQQGTRERKSDESIAAAAARARSGGFLMINGWLIVQGVRAAVVLTVCCGAMFFSSSSR